MGENYFHARFMSIEKDMSPHPHTQITPLPSNGGMTIFTTVLLHNSKPYEISLVMLNTHIPIRIPSLYNSFG